MNITTEQLREIVAAVKPQRPYDLDGKTLFDLVPAVGTCGGRLPWAWSLGNDLWHYCNDADAYAACLVALAGRMGPGTQLVVLGDGEFQVIDTRGECWASSGHKSPLGALWQAFIEHPSLFAEAPQ